MTAVLKRGAGRSKGSVNKGWRRKLSPPIALTAGPVAELVTLKDAADLIV